MSMTLQLCDHRIRGECGYSNRKARRMIKKLSLGLAGALTTLGAMTAATPAQASVGCSYVINSRTHKAWVGATHKGWARVTWVSKGRHYYMTVTVAHKTAWGGWDGSRTGTSKLTKRSVGIVSLRWYSSGGKVKSTTCSTPN